MTDADLLRRILGAMRPDIPMDWHDQAWLAAKGLVTLEAIEADAAGVTLAATPAPLMDIQKQSVVTPAPLGGLRAWLEVQPQYDTEMSNSTRARQKWQREHDAWLQHGPSVVRAALAATPAPLDADVMRLESMGSEQRLIRQLTDAAPAPLAPHPGRNHEYRMTCLGCGEPGYLFVGFCSPGETFRWSEAQPKEADHD